MTEAERPAATGDMAGRTVVISGATSGIGMATAMELARRGANLVILSHSVDRVRYALVEVGGAAGGRMPDVVFMDLAVMASIRSGVSQLLKNHPNVHVLINNAGVVNPERQTTVEGNEATFAVNHLGPFLLTRLLLPSMRDSGPARVVTLSSAAHRRAHMSWDDLQLKDGYTAMRAYSQSKLANILFTRELARRLAGSGTVANCVHPGLVHTELDRRMSLPVRAFFHLFGGTPEKGAEGPVYLASSPAAAAVSGRYFHGTHEATPSREAQDDAAAARLWEISEQLTGPV